MPRTHILTYFLVGIFTFLHFNFNGFIVFGVSLALLFIVNLFIKSKKLACLAKAIFVIFCGYAVIYVHTSFKKANIKLLQEDIKYKTITATVVKNSYNANKLKTTLVVKNVVNAQNGKHLLNKAQLSVKGNHNLTKNSQITAVAYFFAPKENIAINSLNMRKNAFINNLESYGYIIKIKDIKNKNQKLNKFTELTKQYKTNIISKLKQNISNNNFGFATALITGNKNYITDSQNANIKTAGVSHLLAISGYHVSLVGMLVFIAIRFALSLIPFLTINYNIKAFSAFVAILFAWFYVYFVGFPASAIRACLVFSVFMLAYIFNQKIFCFKTFANVALVMLLINPYYVYSIAFVLSFIAYLAILYIIQTKLFIKATKLKLFKQTFFNKLFSYFIGLVLISGFIQFTSFLPVAIFFKEVANYSILTNIIAIPVFSVLIMPFLFLFAVFSNFGFAVYFLKLANFGLNIVLSTSNVVANMPYSTSNVYNTNYIFILIFMVGLVFMLLRFKFALLFILIANISLFSYKNPSIIIDFNNKNVVFVNDNKLESMYKIDNFTKQIMQKSYGILQTNVVIPNHFYKTKINNNNVYFLNQPYNKACKDARLIITKNFITNCPQKTIILSSLNQGVLTIFLNNKIKTHYNINVNQQKAWNKN